MVTLVIPDVHEKIARLRKIIKAYSGVDRIVCLGDFFDNYSESTRGARAACHWLLDNIDDPRIDIVYGNHDIHYAFPWPNDVSPGFISPGFTTEKLKLIRTYLNHNNAWSKFKLIIWVEDYLCSHAGLHPALLHPIFGYERVILDESEKNALELVRYGSVTPFLARGRRRGGFAPVGGVTWLDWRYEFVPIEGLNQIVGHTFDKNPRERITESSKNYCIDTCLKHVILVENNNVIVEALPKKL